MEGSSFDMGSSDAQEAIARAREERARRQAEAGESPASLKGLGRVAPFDSAPSTPPTRLSGLPPFPIVRHRPPSPERLLPAAFYRPAPPEAVGHWDPVMEDTRELAAQAEKRREEEAHSRSSSVQVLEEIEPVSKLMAWINLCIQW